MSSVFLQALRPFRLFLFALVAVGLAGCEANFGGGGPLINTNAPVPVALLLPFGSDNANNDILATSLQNAARLAVSDLGAVKIDLRIYPTAGKPAVAAAAAIKAVDEGAKIILGPVFANTSNAVGAAVASRGISVLSFSNNTRIAGGNVFILGNTFQNTANRLLGYANSNGYGNIMVINADNLSGEIARKAVEQAITNVGATFAGAATYPFTQDGAIAAVPDIAKQVLASNTNAIVFAADTAGALPILAELLPENGVDPRQIKFIGLTRWDIPTQTLSLSGLQGGWFALPDPALTRSFQARYTQAFGRAPHPLAGIAYDGIAAIGALIATGRPDALSRANLTQPSGFAGVNGVFRLLPNGTNERALAVVEIENKQVKVIDPAPTSFGSAGF